MIQARTARLADTAALYTALGGGWQAAGDVATQQP
jgi:outer membrane protein TolC